MAYLHQFKYLNPVDYIEVFKDPLWYLRLENQLQEFFYSYQSSTEKTPEWMETRKEWVILITELLNQNKIALGSKGEDMDAERKLIDTAVIHHSSTPPDASLDIFEALGLIRLYASQYSKPTQSYYSTPIWSNHFYQGKQTFIAYHYLVRQDGSFTQVLEDKYIGWQAGNWDINCRSIAICFIDELENKQPTKAALASAKQIIRKYKLQSIFGHREVREGTDCPGNLFLNGWKKELIL